MDDERSFDWYGAGYDAFPAEDLQQAARHPAPRDEWGLLRATITQARHGAFGLVSQVVRELIGQTRDTELHGVACSVVADAGTAADLEALVLTLQKSTSFDRGLDIVTALAARGRLADVPVLFRFYEMNRRHTDSDSIPIMLDWLLTKPAEESLSAPPEEQWEEYRTAVAERYFRLWNELGTNLIHVYRGRAFALGSLVTAMLKDLRKGLLDPDDRHKFEVTTGLSCSKWFTHGKVNLLQARADLELFHESGKANGYPVGQHIFMGHFIEDVGSAAQIFAAYPPNRGMDVPEVRTIFDVDDYFALPLGFEPFRGGYFVRSTTPPPSAALTIHRDWPWLSLHTCLRAAMSGNRTPLEGLSALIGKDNEPMFQRAAIDLIADAADDCVLDPWRETIRRGASPDLTYSLCWGLLRRSMLCDVPLVLEAYRRNANNPKYAHLESRLNQMFAFQAVRHGPHQPIGCQACCEKTTICYQALSQRLGREDVPIFRGGLFGVIALAREIIDLKYGPELTVDLRQRFEASTGINCSDWETSEGFDPQMAAASAQKFLESRESVAYRPGQLYFFGRPIQQ